MFASLPLRLGGLIQTTVTTPTAPAKRPRAFRTPGFRLHLSSWEAQIHTDLVISSPRSLSWLGRSGEPAWSRLGARARHCRQPIGPRPVFFLCLRCGIVHAWQSLSPLSWSSGFLLNKNQVGYRGRDEPNPTFVMLNSAASPAHVAMSLCMSTCRNSPSRCPDMPQASEPPRS